MKLIALGCRNCGGPLEVPEDAKYVTCTHCRSRLVIKHSGSAAHTEKIDAIDRRTGRIEEQVDNLHRRKALAELDRHWNIKRETYYHGNRRPPSRIHSLACVWIVVLCGILWSGLIAGATIGFWRELQGLGAGILVLLWAVGTSIAVSGLRRCITLHRAAVTYETAEDQYRQRRSELAGELKDEGSD